MEQPYAKSVMKAYIEHNGELYDDIAKKIHQLGWIKSNSFKPKTAVLKRTAVFFTSFQTQKRPAL